MCRGQCFRRGAKCPPKAIQHASGGHPALAAMWRKSCKRKVDSESLRGDNCTVFERCRLGRQSTTQAEPAPGPFGWIRSAA
jgi:hypothetical protein